MPADRVERHPLRGEREAQEDADRGHRDPERAAPPPGAGPDRREQRVRRDDPETDVRVVHPDPRLDEEHPVGDREDPDENRDLAATEEDPGEEVEQPGHQGAGDDARQPPRERMLADFDAGHPAVAGEREDLLSIVGRIRLRDVDRQGGGLERQWGVGEDGVGVRLDHVDRPAVAARGGPEDVDHLGCLVVGDPRPLRRAAESSAGGPARLPPVCHRRR